MPVRKTESRLPTRVPGLPARGRFTPEELGQSVTNNDCSLVSYLTTPLRKDAKNTYVFFSTGSMVIRFYQWTIRELKVDESEDEVESLYNPVTNPDKTLVQESTEYGEFSFVFPRSGKFEIEVNAIGQTSMEPLVTLKLRQTVVPEWTRVFFPDQAIAPNGDEAISKELIGDFWRYIQSAQQRVGEFAVPIEVLAGLVYWGISQSTGSIRSDELETISYELNTASFIGPPSPPVPLGICRWNPAFLYMLLLYETSPSIWKEVPEGDSALGVFNQITEQYIALKLVDNDARVDLFNLVRFPKVAIRFAAKMLARLKNRGHRFPARRMAEFYDLTPPYNLTYLQNLRQIATEYVVGPLSIPTGKMPALSSGHKIVINSAIPIVSVHARAGTDYGPYNLRYDDHDATNGNIKYDKKPRSTADDDDIPTGAVGFVEQLNLDLRKLGFSLAGKVFNQPDELKKFTRMTEWAVREFQIYAKFAGTAIEDTDPARAAEPYWDRVSAYNNETNVRYRGPITGVANLSTQALIKYWVSNLRNWRAPVQVSAWNINPQPLFTPIDLFTVGTTAKDNLWHPKELADDRPRMFSRDFTRFFTLRTGEITAGNAAAPQLDGGVLWLGKYSPFVADPTHGGPITWAASQTYRNSELTHTEFLDRADPDPTDPANASCRSTFKVVRSVSEVECFGYFDAGNAYDDAFMSIGPCHWTMALNHGRAPGELGGYLAFLRDAAPAPFAETFEAFGIRSELTWGEAGLLDTDQQKYTSFIRSQRETDDIGTFGTRVKMSEREIGNYYRSWHWYHRWLMLARTNESFRKKMWDMARIRMKSFLEVPVPLSFSPRASAAENLWAGASIQTKYEDLISRVPSLAGATIEQIFTSERAIAWILQWHIRFPSHICLNFSGTPGDSTTGGAIIYALWRAEQLITALAGLPAGPAPANHPLSAPPANWDSPVAAWGSIEAQLLAGLEDAQATLNNNDITDRMRKVQNWPRRAAYNHQLDASFTALTTNRNGFSFYRARI